VATVGGPTAFSPSPFSGRGAGGEGRDSSHAFPDTAAAREDTTTPPPREFSPPSAIFDSADQALSQIWDSPLWPLPPPADLATGDFADWLTGQPTIDVDDAPGPGQFRRYTRWGLIDRVGDWDVDGRAFGWQRLSFPQAGQFDPTVLPSFEFKRTEVGERVDLRRDTEWPLESHSSYFLRQGDFGETYSQGKFRRRFPRGLGIDLGFLFYENKGRYAYDDRNTRHLRLQLVGPLRGRTFWTVAFDQFSDRSWILPDSVFSALLPRRDDLLYSLDMSVYHPPDSSFFRAGGLRLQSGKQDIRTFDGYDLYGKEKLKSWLESHDHVWTLWGEGASHGWHLNAQGVVEQLRVSPAERSRWGLIAEGRRIWPVGEWGSGSLHVAASSWDTDPIAPSLGMAVSADRGGRSLVPTLRLERSRLVPTLFDRERPRTDLTMPGTSNSGLDQYSEEGDRDLSGEWRNSVTLVLATPRDTSGSRLEFISEAQATYVQRYIRWEDVSVSSSQALYRPVSGDVRSVGAAMALHSRLFWKFHLWVNYAAKYAETLNHQRLAGYYPQKGTAIVSWIAPRFRYGIDLRLNAAFLWWSGDPRIIPTGYTTSQTFRFDLSGSATMKDFTFYYSLQNVANFPYRTSAGYGFTGRTVRFGFNWNFLD